MGTLDAIRSACAEVAAGAAFVGIDHAGLAALAARLGEEDAGPVLLDPAHHHLGDPAETVAYVLTLDAINFGSGWFPHLRKRPGLSGYFTVATSLKERFEARGPWSARELGALDARACAETFGQDPDDAVVGELMALFARALGDLGTFLLREHGGRFEGPFEKAAGSAEALVDELAGMPFFRDVATWHGRPVPLYKRAQLAAADLHLALGGRPPADFRDLDRLTLFADNLVPHVLRWEGALVYVPELAARIDRGERLEAGSPEEVEIRAVAVHAVELLVAAMRAAGTETSARELDYRLWSRGQRPELKAPDRPRHRARSVFY